MVPVVTDVKLHSEGTSRLWLLCMWVRCAWCVPVDVGPRSAKSNAIIDRNYKWCIYSLFAYFDIGWAYRVIFPAALAAEFEYVLSYGQVRTPFCTVDHRMLIEYLPV